MLPKAPAYEALEFLRELGRIIRQRRKEKRVKYVDIWAATGMQPSSVRLMEQGRFFHFGKIYPVLKVLGIRLTISVDE